MKNNFTFQNHMHTIVILIFQICLFGCTPVITNVEPSIGLPGEKISISGDRLTEGSNPQKVDFNGTPASFSKKGNTILATVPEGATTGPIHVQTFSTSFLSKGGIATSPFNFNIPTNAYTEHENNNSFETANDAGLSNLIIGTISDDEDYYKVKSGLSGPWGYGIEFHVVPTVHPTEGVTLSVDIYRYDKHKKESSYIESYTDKNKFTLWETVAPDTDIYLKAYWSGSTSENVSIDYKIRVSRIQINDTNEDDDSFNTAKNIVISDGVGTHDTSYLCNIDKNGNAIGMDDYYSFYPNEAATISLLALTQLDKSDGVTLVLFDNTSQQIMQSNGDYLSSNLHYQMPNGEKASGKWSIRVTNSWYSYTTHGAGNETMPISCKKPYSLKVITK
ncbi:IPT/TIG domain-containing protein [Teredinibacter sp. KSP-S5-2]|uniref:IPT/TIG domain-containing protein n=1 Tax=Teredinibacter sp. KSP-S5-2 TaxID=3034506 RepID=UPI0029349E23|nr:IPT/TIG domain-containing protein [Teredinibacter sp. KSP-S5-2]WNO09937.1 hypothetical protein P5V12_02005 [Teredinibacter sp. KSP-S5-2]